MMTMIKTLDLTHLSYRSAALKSSAATRGVNPGAATKATAAKAEISHFMGSSLRPGPCGRATLGRWAWRPYTRNYIVNGVWAESSIIISIPDLSGQQGPAESVGDFSDRYKTLASGAGHGGRIFPARRPGGGGNWRRPGHR